MSNQRIAFLLVSVFMAGGSIARADATSDARKAIQAQYDRSNAAFAKKDVKGGLSGCTSDHLEVDKGKSTSLADFKQQIAQVLNSATSFSETSTIQTISVKGNTAAVRIKEHAIIQIPNPQTKKTSTMVGDSISDDMWVKSGATWLNKKSVKVTVKMNLDGKEFPQ